MSAALLASLVGRGAAFFGAGPTRAPFARLLASSRIGRPSSSRPAAAAAAEDASLGALPPPPADAPADEDAYLGEAISADEMGALCASLFDMVDADGSGSIDRAELGALLNRVDVLASEEEVHFAAPRARGGGGEVASARPAPN